MSATYRTVSSSNDQLIKPGSKVILFSKNLERKKTCFDSNRGKERSNIEFAWVDGRVTFNHETYHLSSICWQEVRMARREKSWMNLRTNKNEPRVAVAWNWIEVILNVRNFGRIWFSICEIFYSMHRYSVYSFQWIKLFINVLTGFFFNRMQLLI